MEFYLLSLQGMEIMKAKIISCKYPNYWYHDKIGTILLVKELDKQDIIKHSWLAKYSLTDYLVLNYPAIALGLIVKNDCETIKE